LTKVKDAERNRAKELFGSFDDPTELAKSIIAAGALNVPTYATSTLANGSGRSSKAKFTKDQENRLRVLISKANSLAEVQRLEKALNEGRLPAGFGADDAMDET
jgi:U2 small nuclear ribonucleoprotein A'